jgi:Uma2 family endonuclease
MVVTNYIPKITWEKLPEDFALPDEPVDNINQPLLAVALNDSLTTAGKLSPNSLTTTNYGICATVDDKVVVKAPDWSYIDEIRVPRTDVERSYTPQLQGNIPSIVMEFLSDTTETEYSTKPTYPPGKWYFYEQILKVPVYVLFDLKSSDIEVYHLNSSGRYEIQSPNDQGKFWLPQINLFLGIWYGTRDNHTRNWLRWWDEHDQLLLWGAELLAQEKLRADQEKSRADQEKLRAEKLAEKLRELGIEIE